MHQNLSFLAYDEGLGPVDVGHLQLVWLRIECLVKEFGVATYWGDNFAALLLLFIVYDHIVICVQLCRSIFYPKLQPLLFCDGLAVLIIKAQDLTISSESIHAVDFSFADDCPAGDGLCLEVDDKYSHCVRHSVDFNGCVADSVRIVVGSLVYFWGSGFKEG